MNFRVARTSGAAHVNREFGCDLTQFGNLTPDQVRKTAQTAKTLNLQRKLAEAMAWHLEKIYKDKAVIEKLTLQALEQGLIAKAEIDKYVQTAIIAGAKHGANIQKLDHKLQQELQLVQGKLLSDKALQTSAFQQKLLLLKAKNQAASQVQNAAFMERLKQIEIDTQAGITAQQQRTSLNSYINAKDYDPVSLSGTGRNNQGGGLLGDLFNSFTFKRRAAV